MALETLAPSAETLSADLVPLAIGDLHLPFLNDEEHPSTGVRHRKHTCRWSRMVDGADGFMSLQGRPRSRTPTPFCRGRHEGR
ncbi:hypothetical protein ADK65_34260 [Streptomyces sp. NRRL B-1140]|nr:hypothetical protein ADK65_34260 [Streptomyces sp. NRRL B-1140]